MIIIETVLITVLKIILDVSYVLYVSKEYAYQGFNIDYNIYKILLSTIVVMTVFMLFRFNNDKKSIENIIIVILITLIIVPTSVIYGMENTSTIFYVFVNVGMVFTILLSRLPAVKIKDLNIVSEKKLIKIIVLFMFILLLGLIAFEGFPTLRALNFNNVYEIRGSSHIPVALSYLFNWQTKVLSLFLIAYGLYYNKKTLVLLTFSIQLLIFLITAHKIVLFSPFLLIVLYIILKHFKNFNTFYIGSMILGISLAWIIYRTDISEWPASLFIRRMLLVPIKNTNYIFEYFSDLEKVKLSNSILRGIFQYKYDTGIYYLIGKEFYGNPNTNANASFIADSYAQFGLIGILLISIILGIMIWILKSISNGKPLLIVVGCVIIGFFGLVDTALQTSILTGGLSIGMLLILFIKRDAKSFYK